MKKTTIIILLIASCALVVRSQSGTIISAEKWGLDKINVSIDGKFFTSYIFSPNEKYPYFFPVNGPISGASVTSMRNHPYPHHASLFFAWDRVNEGNYWQQELERGQIISYNAEIVKEGGDSVIITNQCIWSRPGAVSPIKDTRKIIITAPSATVRQIDFEITLDMLTDVQMNRTGHALFSARMATDLTVQNGGTMINAEGKINEEGTWGEISDWIDYYGTRGGVIEGLAILQHPSNPWYPTRWFSRNYGFFSENPVNWSDNWTENKEGISIKKGKQLSFRYRVLVHSGDHNEAKIAEAFEKFKNE